MIVAAVLIFGGAAITLSRVRAQQTPSSASPESAHGHDHANESRGMVEPQERPPDEGAPGDHDEHEHESAVDEADDHDHAGEEGHHDHEEEPAIQYSADERARYGIEVETAGPGRLARQIRLPGEIVLNEDRVAHIVPRAPGVVREVLATVGDTVHAGDVMAWLESAELGEAKVDYLTKWAEVGCCTLDLKRAQEVHDNTMRLLETLNASPSIDSLRELNGGAMGENRSVLVSAYAELVFARSAYEREKPLFAKKIASERDLQAAEAAYKKADAMYTATRDSVDFNVRRALLEAKRERQVSKIELEGARRRLFVLGLSSAEIEELEALAKSQTDTLNAEPECNDPNCTECKKRKTTGPSTPGSAVRESEEKLAWYPLRAPFDGTVIEKHLTLGEKHGDDSGAFTVADLTSVWVDVSVYQKDLPYVGKGMSITISGGDGMPSVEGVVAYVAPVVDDKTRTALARVVLANPGGTLRPGLFITAHITVGQEAAAVVVEKSAVQKLGEQPIVFVDASEGFEPTPVTLGRSNESHVEILAGLAAGQRYVTHGAFELKAKIVTSGLGAHAGHGH